MSKSPSALLENLTVKYNTLNNLPSSVQGLFANVFNRNLQVSQVKALDGLDLQIEPGEVLGILGNNGAGKSTLLKIISKIIYPTSGRVRVWGEVTALLGVGIGFQEEFTGRENLYLYSSILGREKSVTDELCDPIIEFSGLSNFIDAPIRTYSSGMVARLGFSVAISKRPDILLVDEVLSVGDHHFRSKCIEKFYEYKKSGTTIILVSHSLNFINDVCDRVLWLETGKVKKLDVPSRVVEEYIHNRQYSTIR